MDEIMRKLSDKATDAVRKGAEFVLDEAGPSLDEIEHELEHTNDRVVEILYEELQTTARAIKRDPQRRWMTRPLLIGLWKIDQDTCYRQPAYDLVDGVARRAPELLAAISDYELEVPENWIVNLDENREENPLVDDALTEDDQGGGSP